MNNPKPIHRRRLVRILFFTGVIITAVSISLHIWFKYNARQVLKKYISEQSHGKIKLELSELDLNLFLNRLQIREADLVSTDSSHEAITYHVTFRKLTLRVSSVWALLFKKELRFDSIKLQDPMIDVMLWRRDTAQQQAKDELSIPQEMGKVYSSMLDALDEFGIQRIIINNAQIRLINKMRSGAEPVTVSKIFFDLSRGIPGQSLEEKKQQTIELRTTNQDIALPGGRHRLAFRSFRLQLLRQRIEFDSCTVTASPTDTSKSNYSIFFKKLFMSGVDFNAMSTQNVIRADSVYGEEPNFNFDLYKSITARKKSGIPDMQKIIQELSGNLDLAFVGIRNAGIHFDVHGKARRSFSNSDKDNFEMTGFRINPDSSEPVTIKRFEMTLRDYHLYNGDSSSAFAFDSLHLLNNRIALNNFSINSGSGRTKVRSGIDITVPYFQLTDLDWYQLIFDQKLAASEASLDKPLINFQYKPRESAGKKFNLYTLFDNLDTLVELDKISVNRGQLNIQLRSGSFNIRDLNLGLQSNKLLTSTNRRQVRNAVEHLSFSNGMLRLKNITAHLQDARLSGDNQLYAGKVSITSANKSITGSVNQVHINNLFFDHGAENINFDGLEWENANLSFKAIQKKKNNNHLHFRNISGKNTQLDFFNGDLFLSTVIHNLTIASLEKDKPPLKIEGLSIAGSGLALRNPSLSVAASDYKLNGIGNSWLRGFRFDQVKQRDTVHLQAPAIGFSADLEHITGNNIHIGSLQITAPEIRYTKWTIPSDSTKPAPRLRIDELSASSPNIFIARHRNDSLSTLQVPPAANSQISARGIELMEAGVQIQSLQVNTNAAIYTKPTGEKLGIDKGNIVLDMTGIFIGKKQWYTTVNSLAVKNEGNISIGKSNQLQFRQASLGNLHVSSGSTGGTGRFIKTNISAWLRIPEGIYSNSNTTLRWYNASYDNTKRILKLDSFQYQPALPLDSVLAHAPYQLDYTTLRTGPVIISGLDAGHYELDSSFIADSVIISQPVLDIYRDKFPPNAPNKKDKPLPALLVQHISLPISVKSLQVEDGRISYTEKNARSRMEGTLLLTNINGTVENVKNHEIAANDTIALQVNGYLMDSARFRVGVKQSYTDPGGGFLINVQVQPTPLSILNPLVIPLSNVMLTSGVLDSLNMQATGGNDHALGEMKMFYHDLRIKLIKDGDAGKTSFGTRLLSFLVNTVLIKNKNDHRTGIMYYKRESSQSFPKYLLKMLISGASSSVGVKKNKKYRKYL